MSCSLTSRAPTARVGLTSWSCLRAGRDEYTLNGDALAYLETRNLAGGRSTSWQGILGKFRVA
ncbi:MAG: hypothetical protein ACRERU_03105 [Methylococcales bacterium]